MLPLSLRDFVFPLPGQVIIRREDTPKTSPSGLLILPERMSKGVKSGIAVILRVGEGCPSYVNEGDRVLVAAGVGRHIPFGDSMGREKERVYVAHTWELLGRIESDTKTEDLGEDERGRFRNPGPLYDQAQDDQADEGNLHGQGERPTT